MAAKLKFLNRIHVKQHGRSDCGVACLLSILRYYEGDEPLENIRRISGTNATGTTLLGLCQAARQLGFDAEGNQADTAALISLGGPCILHVVLDDFLSHYVVCFGYERKEKETCFIIGDPAVGVTRYSRPELETIWRSGACLTLAPNERFRPGKSTRDARRKWVIELVRQDLPLLSIAALLGVAIAIAGLSMAVFTQRLIDDILPKKDFTRVNLGVVLLLAILLIKEGLSFLRQYFLLQQAKGFNTRIIQFFYTHLLRLPKPFFDTRKIGEFTARLNDTGRIQRVISQLAGNVVIDLLISVATLGFLFAYSWQVGLVCALLLPVYFGLIYGHNKAILTAQRQVMSTYALTESNYISTLQGIEPVKNHNKQEAFARTNKAIYENFQVKVFGLGRIQIKLSFLAGSFGVVFLTSVLLFSCHQVLTNHLKPGEMIAILGLCGSLLPGIANLALVSIPINEARIAFERMFEFTSAETEERVGQTAPPHFSSLEVRHLVFGFAGRQNLLKDISFEVRQGEIIAIMGENGCGKSTLSQVLQKQYDYQAGSIAVNTSLELRDISHPHWRRMIGVVPQNIHIFNGSVLENIAFGDAVTDPHKVLQFLEEYGLEGFIASLPQAHMTLVGEEGINLSGGQKQMIALARVLYHRPQLLILDEATSAMDRRAEQYVLNLLLKLKGTMGIVFITHRLHVLRKFCDRIYILENGTVRSKGNHEQLLQSENLYSSYWKDLML